MPRSLNIGVITLILIGGIGFLMFENHSLTQNDSCAQKLDAFKKQVAESESTDGIPNKKTFDVMIAYSPGMSTCVGGYTVSLPFGNTIEQHFLIRNVLTNSIVESFSADTEMIKHPEYLRIQDGRTGAEYQAWEDYKQKLSDLTSGRISAP